MSYTPVQNCIDACIACADACDHCADACMHEANVYAMIDSISLNIDCSEICRLTAGYVARGSKNAPLICEACATICERCQIECSKYQTEQCRACAEACRTCMEACRALAVISRPAHPRRRDAVLAGMRQ